MEAATERTLIKAMLQPDFYDHPVEQVTQIETHISWVFLAGDFAYKVKKPVNFGFLDFSTLAKRHHFCLEELRLNRRFAPQLYLGVNQIGGDPACPEMHGRPALDYAVKMRRFAQQDQLDRVLAAGLMGARQLDRFAIMIAKVHQAADVAGPEQPYGTPQAVIDPVLENFTQIKALLSVKEYRKLNGLEEWTRKCCDDRHEILWQRKAEGFIRECHGDLHLANMAWVDNEPILFDCIEFNDNLRWIDVINDIAFLVMDLDDRGEARLGWHFLNSYLQESGDYQGLQLLRFYKLYRAMVRTKVLCMRLGQPGLSDTERKLDIELYHSYLDLASSYTAKQTRRLIITHGLSGSGKSTFVRKLSDSCGFIHLQSDRERKRLHGLSATTNSHSPPGGGIYDDMANQATYERLQLLAKAVLTAGYSVIVDATFLKMLQRDRLRYLAEELSVPLFILDFQVAEAELRRRIQQRATEGVDISEANMTVLGYQLAEQQPLSEEERALALTVWPDTMPDEVTNRLSERDYDRTQGRFDS